MKTYEFIFPFVDVWAPPSTTREIWIIEKEEEQEQKEEIKK